MDAAFRDVLACSMADQMCEELTQSNSKKASIAADKALAIKEARRANAIESISSVPPEVAPIQGNFGGGEFSPLVHGRVDSDRYATGLETCYNWIPTIQGGLIRRSGTRFVAESNNATPTIVRLVSFEYSTSQAYILEFGENYVRFFKDNGQILKLGVRSSD
jgi:hypothetical protein